MCFEYIYSICCCLKRNEYLTIKEDEKIEEINPTFNNDIDEAIYILKKYESDLIIRYSFNGTIMFTKKWFTWFNHLSNPSFTFMNQFKPPQLSSLNPQLVYICLIPVDYHKEFLEVVKKEYI